MAVASITSGFPLPPISASTALVVEHVGRKTGRTRRTPMGFAKGSADSVDVVAEHGEHSDWVKNALLAGEVQVWIGGKRFRGKPALDPDRDPEDVWKNMRSRSVAAFARFLSSEPKVVHITLEPLP
ncbi:MAG TPA: nitroreductase family deazaflavin-dependent oxidoreductase [Actinomycetota bacterium]|nr:nitroreductase family deazaflavin-dependent oxidoreductase [Actinomycetota bacterium]